MDNLQKDTRAESCVFCKIIKGQIEADILYNDDKFVVIRDINPQAPIHCLAIPKSHFSTISQASPIDILTVGKILKSIPNIFEKLDVDGYRLIINQGIDGGQTVEHYHIHILGGKKFLNF